MCQSGFTFSDPEKGDFGFGIYGDNDEIRSVSASFTGTFATRNRGLFMLGVSTGGSVGERNVIMKTLLSENQPL